MIAQDIEGYIRVGCEGKYPMSNTLSNVTITEIMDDLRAADEVTRRFERRYWLSSADFFELYRQGLLDDGDHAEDFALWAGFHQIKLDRETALQKLSHERLQRLRTQTEGDVVMIDPHEPALVSSD